MRDHVNVDSCGFSSSNRGLFAHRAFKTGIECPELSRVANPCMWEVLHYLVISLDRKQGDEPKGARAMDAEKEMLPVME